MHYQKFIGKWDVGESESIESIPTFDIEKLTILVSTNEGKNTFTIYDFPYTSTCSKTSMTGYHNKPVK